jgi:hypothetical protein
MLRRRARTVNIRRGTQLNRNDLAPFQHRKRANLGLNRRIQRGWREALDRPASSAPGGLSRGGRRLDSGTRMR